MQLYSDPVPSLVHGNRVPTSDFFLPSAASALCNYDVGLGQASSQLVPYGHGCHCLYLYQEERSANHQVSTHSKQITHLR